MVVLRADTWEVIERAGVVAEAKFPYVPGLLSFREPCGDRGVRAVDSSAGRPGLRRPRDRPPATAGLASHLGLWLNLPTIGCAKSWFHGDYEEPGLTRGDRSPLTDAGETIGAVLRTRTGVKPLFVSPGHLCDLAGAIAVVLAASPTYRQPMTSRLAHQYVNDLRRAGPGTGLSQTECGNSGTAGSDDRSG